MGAAMKIKEAEEWSGKSRSTLMRAIKKKILSAEKDPSSGEWNINPGHLAQLYDLKLPGEVSAENGGQVEQVMTGHDIGQMTQVNTDQIRNLEAQLETERRLSDERGKTIEDLRTRLDHSEQRRDEVTTQLTALLTDQRPEATQKPAERPKTRAGFWVALALVVVILSAVGAFLWFSGGQAG